MIRIKYMDHVIHKYNLNIRINSLNGKLATATRIPGIPPTMLLSNQPPQHFHLHPSGTSLNNEKLTPKGESKEESEPSEL